MQPLGADMTYETLSTAAEELDPGIRALLPNYIRRRESDMEAIERLFKRKDYAEIAVLAHNMRGSGAAYGYPRISELGGQIEKAVEANNVENLTSLIDELSAYVKQMRPL